MGLVRLSRAGNLFIGHRAIYRNDDLAQSSWLTSRLLYQVAPSRLGTIAAGTEISADLSAWQRNYDEVQPRAWNLNVSDRKVQTALPVQDERALSPHWKVVAGARFDNSSAYGGALSSRGGLLFQQSERTVWKLIAGRFYRDPSDYEQLYNGVSGFELALPLRSESALTAELNVEHRLNRHWSVIGGAYQFQLSNAIELINVAGPNQAGVGTALPTEQFENGVRVRSTGLEAELNGKFDRTFDVSANLSLQSSGDAGRTSLPSSPSAVAAFRCSRSFWRDRLTLAGGLHYVSNRSTLEGATTGAAWLPEATLGLRKFANGLDLQVGVRNLAGSTFSEPIALDPRVDSIPSQGRSFFIRLQWQGAN